MVLPAYILHPHHNPLSPVCAIFLYSEIKSLEMMPVKTVLVLVLEFFLQKLAVTCWEHAAWVHCESHENFSNSGLSCMASCRKKQVTLTRNQVGDGHDKMADMSS